MGSSVSKYHEERMSSREIYNAMDGKDNIPKKDKYVQKVKESFEKRSQTGIEKYNTTLERTDLGFLDWLQHLQEELMDATLYIERLKTSYAEEITKNSNGDSQ